METRVDFSGLIELISSLDKMGADVDGIAKKVLKKAVPTAIAVYRQNVPRSTRNKKHAQDSVFQIGTFKQSKIGSVYVLVGVVGGKLENSRLGNEFDYLFVREFGRSDMQARPWMDNATTKTQQAVLPILERELINEINDRLGGTDG